MLVIGKSYLDRARAYHYYYIYDFRANYLVTESEGGGDLVELVCYVRETYEKGC